MEMMNPDPPHPDPKKSAADPSLPPVVEPVLADLLDLPAIQAMMDSFYALDRIAMAIVDLHGHVLVATGWQDICTKFHRVHPDSCKHCVESDTALSSGIAPGEFKLYRCRNHMWDMATPIVVGGRHVGNFFLGQFFFDDEQPDLDLFRAQARQYGFDEKEYLAALDRVPRRRRDDVNRVMSFCIRFVRQISTLGYRNLQLSQALANQRQAEEKLRGSEAQLSNALEMAHAGHWEYDVASDLFTFNDNFYRIFRTTAEQAGGYRMSSAEYARRFCHPDDMVLVARETQAAIAAPDPHYSRQLEHRILYADGSIGHVAVRFFIVKDAQGRTVQTYGVNQDVTDRKQTEAALEESEALYRSILNASPDDITLTDLEGRILMVSPSAVKMFGYARTEQLIGRRVFEFIVPDDRDRAAADIARLHQGTTTAPIGYRNEYRGLRADGGALDIEVNGEFIRDANGQPIRMLLIVRDITDRKRIEEKLRDSERQYMLLFESMSSGFALHEIIVDEAGKPCDYRFLQVNPAFETLTGLKADALIGRTVREVLPGTESIWIERYGRVALTGEPDTFENYSCELGRHYQVTAYRPQPGQFAVLLSDITELKRTEAALRESEALHRSILNASPDDITIADLDGRVLMVSPAAQVMFRAKPEQPMIGRSVVEFIAPADRERAAADLARMFQGVFSGPGEYHALRDDGSLFDVEVNGEFIRDGNGQPLRMILIARDITARKQAEESLRESEQRHRDYLAYSPYSIFVADAKGRLVQVNPAACRITGFSEKELLTMTVPDLHGEDGRKEAARHFLSVVREGKATGELTFRTKSGELRWWLVSAVKISDSRFLGFCNDITDRKRAEERLRASEEQFRDISTNIPGVIYQLQTGRIGSLEATYMSAACETLFEQSLAGLDFSALLFDHMHAGDRALFQHSLAKAAKNMERWNLEFRILPARDRVKWLRGSANPRKLSNGAVIWNGVLLDITELKLAEQSLREREAFQDLLMDTIPSPVFYKDRQGRYLGFNKAFEAFYGMSKEQMIGKSVFDIAPPDLAQIYHAKDAVLFEQPGTQIYEAPMRDAAGNLRDVVFYKASIIDAQGEVSGLIGILLDITGRKRAEAKILHESALNATIIESIPGTFYMLDETGAYIRWSRYQRDEIAGKPEDQMAGTPALSTIHPDDRDLIQARIANVLKTGAEEVVEGRVLLRGGPDFRWLLMTGRRMFIQGRPALIGIGIDITERKWAEEQVAQQLDELRRWQTVTLGREGRVAELKREVNAFAVRLGQPPPYPSAEAT